MNSFDTERERIGRQLEEGFLTPTEHRRLVRAMERAEARKRSKDCARRRALRQIDKAPREQPA